MAVYTPLIMVWIGGLCACSSKPVLLDSGEVDRTAPELGGGSTNTLTDSGIEGGDTAGSAPSDTSAGGEDGPSLSIAVEGDLSDSAPDDGLASQTPEPYSCGLQRLELLRTADDPDPVVIFDYSPGRVQVDMTAFTEVARVPMASMPDDTFRWFRFSLTDLDAEVEATVHEVPVLGTLTTRLSIAYALSDYESGASYLQGTVTISGEVYGVPFSVSQLWPMLYPELAPSTSVESVDGHTVVTSELPEPLDIRALESDLTLVIRYYVADSFRWRDEAGAEDIDGRWDLHLSPPSVEPVVRFGANAYDVYILE